MVVDIVPLGERAVGTPSKMVVFGELWGILLVLDSLFALISCQQDRISPDSP
jgi:hypothetical protein